MAIIRNQITNDVNMVESSSLQGQIIGCVTLNSGVNLQMHGMIIGKLILEKDSEAFIHGTINGDIENNGGHLYVYGTVNGKIHENSGTVKVMAGSRVGKPLL